MRGIEMALGIRRKSSNRLRLIATLIAVFALATQPIYGPVAGQLAKAISPAAPSTNDINRSKNWAHANETSKTANSITFDFISKRNFLSCFEYRADGEVSQKTSNTNPNTEILDGRYPANCVGNSTVAKTVNAADYVEVRMVYGAEKNERFDWTRFDVAPDTEKPTVSIVSPLGNAFPSNTTISIKATDNKELDKIVGNIYLNNGTLYKSTQVAAASTIEKLHYIDLGTIAGGSPLPQGKYYIKYNALDKAGNMSSTGTFNFTVDNTIPKIVIKPSSTGVDGVYTKVDFSLQDNDKIVKAVINDYEKPLSPNPYSDVNGVKVGSVGGKYGNNTIRAIDAAGNEASLNFILDNKAPTVTLKDGSDTIGASPYSKVSFKLYDDYKIAKAEVNGQVISLSPNKWSDLNNIKVGSMGGKLGINVVKVYDLVGNVTEVTFELDNVAPTATFTHSNNNDNTLVNTDVTSTLHASEPISIPTGWTLVDGTNNQEFTKVSTENNKGWMTVTDLAGNSNDVWFEVKRIDKTAPTFNVNNGDVLGTSSVEVIATEDNISSISIDGSVVAYTGSKPNYKVVVSGEGSHTVIAKDKAGNEKQVTFTIDTQNPVVTLNASSTGLTNQSVTVTRKVSDTNLDYYTYCVQRDGIEINNCSTHRTGELDDVVSFTDDGSYTVSLKAWDKAGNATARTVSFTIDMTNPATPIILQASSLGVSGTGEPGSTIAVFVDGVLVGTVVVGVDGLWSYIFNPSLSTASSHRIAVHATDAAGNTSGVSPESIIPAVVGEDATIDAPVPTQITPANLVNPQASAASTSSSATTPSDEEETGEVLGTDTKDTPLEQTAALAPSEQGWKLWGVAWYWYLLVVAFFMAMWWLIAGLRRRRADQEEF